ncbi:glycoside hydrolase family 127 protein [Geothrix sp. PMB-07]|uniref:glycoside hydrolase family 127 protein n=1 Tax=Geothrix sp. PMB-07 TaxID=3068640 RepID=UPI002740B6E6|nr:glycoside hydrolase family 127 protein [Geothrix sp. PMB-07]WLT30954.1 glycoside hydrolase family 127 protein [Geothrix sp. PMB-07]
MKAIIPFCLFTILAPAQVARPIQPVIADVARPLPLQSVRLTGGPLKHAQDLDAVYLLSLEPDRMLANFRKRAGLPPKAEPYGGWDGDGKNLSGHILGHYLSAISLMGSATGDARFKARVDYILSELKVVQDKQGDGYLGALEQGKERFEEVARGDIRSGGFDLNGLWSPWYVQHKIYAGLRDAYRCTGNPLALAIEIKFAAWAERTLAGLNDAQLQKMLNTEFGAMNEVLADLYADTGDRRWLDLSYRFEHTAVLEPLKRHQDKLSGLHGNTQVPKLMGNLARYAYTGDSGDGFAASFFWDRVVQHHTFATGGHGKNEYFFDADHMSDSVDGRTAETCNVYNMIKMARKLFALRPDPFYAEFHERALFNHILASMDPQDGRTCYMVPVGRGVQHEYQDMEHDFTCCVGSGMESHALHAFGIYYEAGNRLWVNLYTPTTANWESAGVSVATATDLPLGDQATLTFTVKSPKAFTLNLRRPAWAQEGFQVEVNGEKLPSLAKAGAYVEITRTWKSGDVVRLLMPKKLRLEALPDNPRRAAILWGPLVLAGNLGPEENFETWKEGNVPVLVAAERPLDQWIKPVPGKLGQFRTEGAGNPHEVDLVPFFQLHRRSYAVYFDLFTPKEWQARSAEYAAAAERQRRLQLATVAYAQPGEMQPERDFNFKGEGLILEEMRRIQGRPFRHAKQWFSFDLPVDATHPTAVVLTYFQDEWRKRTFRILVDGQKVADEVIERGGIPHFFDREYAVPQALVQGKKSVTVRIEATPDSETPAIFGVRTIRADAQR